MKKCYAEPEFDIIKFNFESILEGDDNGDFENLVPSDPQGYAGGYGGGLD